MQNIRHPYGWPSGVIQSESQKHYCGDQNLASGIPEAINGAALAMAVLGVINFFWQFSGMVLRQQDKTVMR